MFYLYFEHQQVETNSFNFFSKLKLFYTFYYLPKSLSQSTRGGLKKQEELAVSINIPFLNIVKNINFSLF